MRRNNHADSPPPRPWPPSRFRMKMPLRCLTPQHISVPRMLFAACRYMMSPPATAALKNSNKYLWSISPASLMPRPYHADSPRALLPILIPSPPLRDVLHCRQSAQERYDGRCNFDDIGCKFPAFMRGYLLIFSARAESYHFRYICGRHRQLLRFTAMLAA